MREGRCAEDDSRCHSARAAQPAAPARNVGGRKLICRRALPRARNGQRADAEGALVPAGLLAAGQVPAAVSARTRDDQLVGDRRVAAPARRFVATAHGKAGVSLTACLQTYVEGGTEGRRRRNHRPPLPPEHAVHCRTCL